MRALLFSCTSYLWLTLAEQVPLNNNSPLNAEFGNLIAQLSEHWHVPGTSVAVISGDETYSEGYGISNFPSQKVTPETLFYTGSTTKSFTAAGISLLIDDTANSSRPITWQTRLSSLIREDFVLDDDYATLHLTLEDALSHRTGMPRHDFTLAVPNTTVRSVVRDLRHLPLTAEIRTKFQYCNLMFIVVSHAIETVTKTRLGDFFSQRIWGPLRMSLTFFSLHDALAAVSTSHASLARGYLYINHTQNYVPVPWLDSPAVSGAGHVISNVLDYAAWLRAMMTMSPPLSSAGHIALRTPRVNIDLSEKNTVPQSYALGWFHSGYRGESMFWHTGDVPGFGAIMVFLPARQWGCAMMGNTAETSSFVQQVLLFKLLDDLLGIPEDERVDRRALIDASIRTSEDRLRHAVDRLYPDAPGTKDKVALSLPLEKYTGTYFHPAYRNVTLVLVDRTKTSPPGHTSEPAARGLHTELTRLGTFFVDFEHVNGEYFVLRGRATNETDDVYDPLQNFAMRAEFRVGSTGKAEKLGIQFEEETGGELIWFHRV